MCDPVLVSREAIGAEATAAGAGAAAVAGGYTLPVGTYDPSARRCGHSTSTTHQCRKTASIRQWRHGKVSWARVAGNVHGHQAWSAAPEVLQQTPRQCRESSFDPRP